MSESESESNKSSSLIYIELSITSPACDLDVCFSVDLEQESDSAIIQLTESENLFLSDNESDDQSMDSCDSESESDMNIFDLITQLSLCEEELLFQSNGLKHVKHLQNTAQGNILEALTSKTDRGIDVPVQIKKIDKVCAEAKTSLKDGNNMRYIVDDSITKEHAILEYLSNEKSVESINGPIAFFQSESDYYLVTQSYDMSLKQFCANAETHIRNGTLNRKTYLALIKNIFFQIAAAIDWLHSDMQC